MKYCIHAVFRGAEGLQTLNRDSLRLITMAYVYSLMNSQAGPSKKLQLLPYSRETFVLKV